MSKPLIKNVDRVKCIDCVADIDTENNTYTIRRNTMARNYEYPTIEGKLRTPQNVKLYAETEKYTMTIELRDFEVVPDYNEYFGYDYMLEVSNLAGVKMCFPLKDFQMNFAETNNLPEWAKILLKNYFYTITTETISVIN